MASVDLDETEERLIKAWRRSGMTLGRLLVYAANEYAVAASESIPGMRDAALVRYAEQYAATHGNAPERAAKGGA